MRETALAAGPWHAELGALGVRSARLDEGCVLHLIDAALLHHGVKDGGEKMGAGGCGHPVEVGRRGPARHGEFWGWRRILLRLDWPRPFGRGCSDVI